jgi:hypothetical protein
MRASASWLGEAHAHSAYDCRLVRKNSWLLTSGEDGSVALWDLRNGMLDRIAPRFREGADALAWSEVAGRGAMGSRRGEITLFDISEAGSLRVRGRFSAGVRGWVLRAEFSEDGGYLAVAGREGAVQVLHAGKLFEWAAARLGRADPPAPIWPCCILESGAGAAFMGNHSHDRRLYSTVNTREEGPFPLRCATYVLDTTTDLIVGEIAGALEVINPRSGNRGQFLDLNGEHISSMAISADGRQLGLLIEKRLDIYSIDTRSAACVPAHSIDIAPYLEERGIDELRAGVPLMFTADNREVWLALEPVCRLKATGPDGLRLEDTPTPNHVLAAIHLSNGTLRDTNVLYIG